jgi:hypothetical protein
MREITNYWVGLACGAALLVGQRAFAAEAKDIQKVKGIKEGEFGKIKDHIRVR